MPNLSTCFILPLLLLTLCKAQAQDIHEFWDSRCEECHGHSGEFARKYLWVFDDQLQGQHHIKDLHLFMRNHYIPDHLIDAVYELLQTQANTPARFKNECSSCHDSADNFVRKSIFVKTGELTGAASGMAVETFLETHRDLTKADVEFYTKLLKRMMIEVYGP